MTFTSRVIVTPSCRWPFNPPVPRPAAPLLAGLTAALPLLAGLTAMLAGLTAMLARLPAALAMLAWPAPWRKEKLYIS